MLIREACLIGVGVDDVDSHLAASTVGPGGCDGVADTAVHQPAWTALVKSLVPSGVQLPGGGQGGVEFLAVLDSLLIGEAVIVAGEEDLTLERNSSIQRKKIHVLLITHVHFSNLIASGCEMVDAPHLPDVLRNKIHRRPRWLASCRRI